MTLNEPIDKLTAIRDEAPENGGIPVLLDQDRGYWSMEALFVLTTRPVTIDGVDMHWPDPNGKPAVVLE